MRIWVDLTNSPHVCVMRPLVALMKEDGHEVHISARDFAQTVELCDRFGLETTVIGHHRGRRIAAKAYGLASRSLALCRWAKGKEFDLAAGHGSNDISVAAKLLKVPSVTMFDYEFATVQHNINCRLARRVVVPGCIPPESLYRYGARGKIANYPGLKEEYYLSDFEPDSRVLEGLSLDEARPTVVLRTPPDVSLYHRFENDLQTRLVRWLAAQSEAQVVALPRTQEQRSELLSLGAGNFKVPKTAIDAQSLVAYADLLVSAGGTMNREAVALGTPVYSTFQGRLGAVDKGLVAEGRLRLLSDPDEIEIKKKGQLGYERKRRDPRQLLDLLLNFP